MSHTTTYPQPTGCTLNDLINHLHRVASALDAEVEDVASETGLTEMSWVTEHYTERQWMVRRMVRLAHELNSMLPDRLRDPVRPDAQPTSYGNP